MSGQCTGVHVQFCTQGGWFREGNQLACIPEVCNTNFNSYRPDMTRHTLDETLLTNSFGKHFLKAPQTNSNLSFKRCKP